MQQKFSVWFYIGALLAFYGVVLTIAGAYQWRHPPPTVLSQYDPTLCAGLVLLLIGVVYLAIYWRA